jgi:hypothetical protein
MEDMCLVLYLLNRDNFPGRRPGPEPISGRVSDATPSVHLLKRSSNRGYFLPKPGE